MRTACTALMQSARSGCAIFRIRHTVSPFDPRFRHVIERVEIRRFMPTTIGVQHTRSHRHILEKSGKRIIRRRNVQMGIARARTRRERIVNGKRSRPTIERFPAADKRRPISCEQSRVLKPGIGEQVICTAPCEHHTPLATSPATKRNGCTSLETPPKELPQPEVKRIQRASDRRPVPAIMILTFVKAVFPRDSPNSAEFPQKLFPIAVFERGRVQARYDPRANSPFDM